MTKKELVVTLLTMNYTDEKTIYNHKKIGWKISKLEPTKENFKEKDVILFFPLSKTTFKTKKEVLER